MQIKSESFLEDLNNILNSGDVPNIYQLEELDKIFQGMKGIVTEMGLAATKSNLFAVYQKQVRANLHTVVTMRYVFFLLSCVITKIQFFAVNLLFSVMSDSHAYI